MATGSPGLRSAERSQRNGLVRDARTGAFVAGRVHAVARSNGYESTLAGLRQP